MRQHHGASYRVTWQGYGKRIEQSILDLQSQIGRRLTYDEIGEAIARVEKRREGAYGQPAVSAWIAQRNEPTLATLEAMAVVFGHRDASWLAFGITEGRSGGTPSPLIDLKAAPALAMRRATTEEAPERKRRTR